MQTSLPVYYDSDLTGLTDSLCGREAVEENERGKVDSTKDTPSPQPELRPMYRGLPLLFPAWQKQMGEGSNSAWSPSTTECEIQQFD